MYSGAEKKARAYIHIKSVFALLRVSETQCVAAVACLLLQSSWSMINLI